MAQKSPQRSDDDAWGESFLLSGSPPGGVPPRSLPLRGGNVSAGERRLTSPPLSESVANRLDRQPLEFTPQIRPVPVAKSLPRHQQHTNQLPRRIDPALGAERPAVPVRTG